MGKVGMTPTPAKMRKEAARSVFAGPLDQKKQRQSKRRRCKRRHDERRLRHQMFREIVARADRQFDAGMFRKPERTPVRGANAWPMKKEGTPDL